MKQDIIQTSFAGGEFGPSLYGRTDIAQYANACQIVENFLIRPYGSAISTPGTKYVATVSDSTLRTRLLKFVFNRTDAYAIESGDLYMRFYTNRGQVVTPSGTEDLSAFGSNLKAHWKCNDNTNSSTVIDATGSHGGTLSTLTTSVSTTGIVSNAFNLDGLYHVSVVDSDDFTRTASSQPMTIAGWFYYEKNAATQTLVSKAGEYELSVNSSDALSFNATSGLTGTVLLLHMDGTDASTTFTDSSSGAKTVTANGNAQIDTGRFKFGTAGGLLDGTGDYLSLADSADWDFGTGDFTIDFWVYLAADVGATLFEIGDVVGGAGTGVSMEWSGSNWSFYINSGTPNITVTRPSLNAWHHVAIVRSGSNTIVFLDGTSAGTGTSTDNITAGAVGMAIGAQTGGSNIMGQASFDEFRIVKGTAVWTGNFSVPSSAYQVAATNSWSAATGIDTGWNFIAAVFKGDGTSSADCKLYVNADVQSISFTSDPGFTNMANTTSLFRIGTNSSGGANIWANKIDDIAFLHQELTAVQIAGLYTTTAYQLTTVFRDNEIFDVHYTQLNDVIWLAHPNHPPQKLIRTSANEWTIADFAFLGGPFLDDNTTSITLTASATTGTVNITVTPTNSNLFTVSGSTLGHKNSYWMIGGLSQTNATTGLQEMGYVKLTNVVNSYTATATVLKNLKTTSATAVWAEGAWSAVRGYPSRVVFHDSRLWFGRTNYEPQKIWGSKIFVYDNYALDTQDDDDALNLALVSNEANELQWLASTKNLLSGTYGGGFVISSGGDNLAITPDNARADEEIGVGSAPLQPKRIGQFLYFVQRFKKTLRELFYVWDMNSYKAVDRTILSPHILGDGIIEMDVQNDPDPVLFCVRTEGTLAMLTREPDQEFAAWSRQTTAGTYTSIAIIPSQVADYDEAWVIVERWINGSQKKYVEYFENPEPPARQDQCVYLHSALTYDAYNVSSLSAATISLSASSGSVTLTSSTAYFVGANINKRLRAIDASGTTLGEGTITGTNSTTSITLSITTNFNSLAYTAGRWGVSASTVSGVDHLEAKTVGILADGVKESLTRTVASGTITMGSNYFVVHVGLSYNQIIYTLPREAATQRGTAQGKLQRINELAFKVNRSYLGFQYGTDVSNLDSLMSVDSTLTNSLTTTVIGNLPFRGGYQRGSQIYIKNADPLPIELLSIMATLDTEEK